MPSIQATLDTLKFISNTLSMGAHMETAIYKKYQTKYKLPDLKDLQKDFPLKLENKESILSDIIDSMFNKISSVTESFEGVMTGEGFAAVFEASMLSATERDEVFRIYKNMRSLLWDARLALSRGNEKEIAEVIKKTYTIWNNNSESVANVCKRLSDGWKNLDVSKIADTLYHR